MRLVSLVRSLWANLARRDVEQVKESARDAWVGNTITLLARELRDAPRFRRACAGGGGPWNRRRANPKATLVVAKQFHGVAPAITEDVRGSAHRLLGQVLSHECVQNGE